MAKLTINPTSIYKNSRENFVLNKEALYMFTRTVSALNDSVYGIQPTKAQYISGISIEDISATHSLCADVYFMEQNMDAVKYFFSRNFIICDNVADRNEKANNPFAVYLTPVVPENTNETAGTLNVDTGSEAMTAFENNDHYEWIYVLPEALSSFEDMKDIYLSCLNGAKLTSFGGKWELIGSTSLTDEKIASLFRDVNETIETNVQHLYEAIAAEAAAREKADDEIIDTLTAYADDLENKIDAEAADRKAADEELKNELTAFVSDLADKINQEITDRISADNEIKDNLTTEVLRAIAAESQLREAIAAAEAARKAADEALEDELTAFASDLNDRIDQEKEDRENADANLQGQLDELTAFSDELEQKIENEIAERKAADEKIEDELTAFVEELNGNIADEAEARAEADQEIIDSLTAYILSVGPAEESETELTSDFDNYRYRFYQGGREVGYIDIAKDQFVEDADFQGTILVLHLRGGQTISTDLKDVVDVLHGSTTDTISVYVDTETNEIAATLVEKYALLEDFENEIEERIAADEAIMTAFNEFKDNVEVSAANLCTEISSTNETLNSFIDLTTDELSTNINPKLSTIAECVEDEVDRVDEISARLDSFDGYYLPLTGGTLTGNLAIENGNLKIKNITVNDTNNGVQMLLRETELLNISGNHVLVNGTTSPKNLSVVAINSNVLSGRNKSVAINSDMGENGYTPNNTGSIAINGKLENQAYGVVINGTILSGNWPYSTGGIVVGSVLSGSGSVFLDGSFSVVPDYPNYGNNSVMIGSYNTISGNNSVSLGTRAFVYGNNAIGIGGAVSANNAIQLGTGTNGSSVQNSEPSSFNVFQYKMLNANGIIPDARISSNILRRADLSAVGLSDYLNLSGGTMNGNIYSPDGFALGTEDSIMTAYIAPDWSTSQLRLCVDYHVNGDEEYLLNNASPGKKISLTIDKIYPYYRNPRIGQNEPAPLSVIAGMQPGTYELTFMSDPEYIDFIDYGYVWEYSLSDENSNYKIVLVKENYPSEKEEYKFFGLEFWCVPPEAAGELCVLYENTYEDDSWRKEHDLISYGETSKLVTENFVNKEFIKKSDLCAAIVPTLESYNHYLSGDRPTSISTIIDWNRAIHTALLSCCGIVNA